MADMKLIKAFNSAMHAETGGTEPYDTTAEVVRVEGSTAWVHIPGGVDETPVQMTVNAEPGDIVQVRVGGGQAWIVGNASAPPTDDKTANAAKQTATEAQEAAVEASDTATRAARNADSAIKIAGNTAQHFWFAETGTDTGAHITEVTEEEFLNDPANGGGNLLARSNGIAIRDGLTELASFGEATQIGESSNNHITIDQRRVKMEDSSAVTFFEVYDLREDGVATITETFTGDGQTTSFAVMLRPSSTVSVVDSSNPSNTYTLSGLTYTLGSAPASRATITITYNTRSSEAKAFTLGTRLNGSTSGPMSVAEGVEVTASAYAAHAEGWRTVASGPRSHAEGTLAHAEGKYSHAEGSSTNAYGESAHVEGNNTTASSSGYAAHAEGKNATAMGAQSHAEGFYTRAAADNSHAQNNHTAAYSADQTALGRYNVWDTNNAYSVIVGNGTSNNARSNALALTWDGNPLLGLAPFQPTSDTVIDSTKTYYQYNFLEEKYVVVANPDVSEIESYYELTGTDGDLYVAVAALGWESEVIG